MDKQQTKPMKRLSTYFIGGLIFFVLLTGSIWYLMNYSNQIIQKKKVEFAEYRLNELNQIYINFLKAVRDNRGYRLYQTEASQTEYFIHKESVLSLMKQYQLFSEFTQDSILFSEISHLILLRIEDLDAQIVSFMANPLYNRPKEDLEVLDSLTKTLEHKYHALYDYWFKQSQQASKAFDQEKWINDQLFILWLIASVALTLLFLYTFKRKINSQIRHKVAVETLKVIRQKEREFSSAFDFASIGMALVSPSSAILRVNRSLCQLLGYAEQELLNLNFQEIAHPDDLLKERDYVRQMLKQEIETYQLEKRYFARSGDLVWTLLSVSLVWDNSQPKYFIAQILDITHMKKLEEALNLERQRFTTIFNSTYQFIGFLDPEGTLLEANETAVNFAGVAPQDVIGKKFWDCHWWQISGETQDQLKAAIQRAASGEEVNYEVAIWDKNKDSKTILFTLKPLKDQNGKVTYIIPEATLIQDLIDYRNLLEAKNQELEGFAAIAAHDLKEPLRMIRQFMERLSQEYQSKLDEKAQKYIHMASDGAKRMNALINDLLDYAEIGGAGEATFARVDLNEVFNETVALHTAVMTVKNTIVSKSELPIIWGHKTAMKLLFQNLIGNGLKYQQAGNQPVVHVSCSESDTSYTLAFKDNGIGIPEENLTKIFNLFTRLHSKTEYEGTGMGLAICKKIVNLHFGLIWVESKLNLGSAFYFTVPKQRT